MKLKNNKGFSLIEIIISMAIVSIIGLVFYNIIYTGLMTRNISRERLEAMVLSSSVMDEVNSTQSSWKNLNGLDVWLTNDKNNYQKIDQTFVKTVIDSNDINYNVRILINESTEMKELLQLEVTIDSPNVNNIKLITRIREDN